MPTTPPSSSQTPHAVSENWSVIWDCIAAEIPDRPAIISPAGTTTYGELADHAARLAFTLAHHGLGVDDKVAIYMYNRPEYLEAIYATFRVGSIPVNINFRYRAAELVALLEASEAQVVVFPSSLAERIATVAGQFEHALLLIQVPDDKSALLPGAIWWKDALSAPPAPQSPDIGGDDKIFMFTGGTTGLPKAMIWMHGQLFDSQLVSAYGALGVEFPSSLLEVVDIAVNEDVPTPTTLPITPLMHAMSMFNTMNTLLLGGSVVFLSEPRFDPARALAAVERERVNRIIIAGNAVASPLADELDRAVAAGTPYDLESVELVMSSGMAWTDQSKLGLLRHMDAHLFDVVGSSEGGPFAYSSVWSEADLPSTLRLAHGAVVLDADGKELDPESGAIGMLAYKGAMPLGYYKDPEKTAQVYRTFGAYRYVMPGDYVKLLGERRIEFLGRGSSVVNTGGEKVYPAEVEEAILAHPAVADCAVFGAPSERWGEIVVAIVETHRGQTLDLPDLRAHLDSRLAGYKKPKTVVFVDSLGRGPTGKFDIPKLKNLITDHPGIQTKENTNAS